MDAIALRRASLNELESLYAATAAVDPPRGRFEGRVLARLENRGARRRSLRALEWLGFEALRFGVDFDDNVWTFTRKKIPAGRFRIAIGASRWRDTEVVQLHYDASRLPRFVSRTLYDEVKPISPELCLGLGGIRAPKGLGDHFFFSLERI